MGIPEMKSQLGRGIQITKLSGNKKEGKNPSVVERSLFSKFMILQCLIEQEKEGKKEINI